MDGDFPAIVNLLWWQAMQRAEAAYVEFFRAGINFRSWNNYGLHHLYVHGRTSTERLGVRHLVYWYEIGWEHEQYDPVEWQEWFQRNQYSLLTYQAITELDSELATLEENRCQCCNRASRICALASSFEHASCDDW